jgi:hypothetical protein
VLALALKHHVLQTYERSEATAPRRLHLGTRRRWAVSFTPDSCTFGKRTLGSYVIGIGVSHRVLLKHVKNCSVNPTPIVRSPTQNSSWFSSAALNVGEMCMRICGRNTSLSARRQSGR